MKGLPVGASRRIIAKVEALRVGNYRVLFEVDHGTVTVYRVLHRKDAYS